MVIHCPCKNSLLLPNSSRRLLTLFLLNRLCAPLFHLSYTIPCSVSSHVHLHAYVLPIFISSYVSSFGCIISIGADSESQDYTTAHRQTPKFRLRVHERPEHPTILSRPLAHVHFRLAFGQLHLLAPCNVASPGRSHRLE